MSAYSDNLWAEEMGIDLEQLATEHPTHPDQIRLRRKLDRQSQEYWARERFLAQLGPAPVETPEPVAVKSPKKPAKVRRYEFTDTQLQIALRVLNEKGAV
jgi:hypothetical protein